MFLGLQKHPIIWFQNEKTRKRRQKENNLQKHNKSLFFYVGEIKMEKRILTPFIGESNGKGLFYPYKFKTAIIWNVSFDFWLHITEKERLELEALLKVLNKLGCKREWILVVIWKKRRQQKSFYNLL